MITKRKWYDKEIETSLLGFGCMRLKTKNGEIDEEESLKLIDIAYKNGVNYFDTAMPYSDGKNETFVGKALQRYKRESFYLATKFSFGCFKTKEEAIAIIDKQLKALQTDYIDFYLLHAMSKERFELFKKWDMMKEIIKWKEEGKIRHIGFSFHDSLDVFKEIVDYYDWEFVQIQLNYMDTDIQQGLEGYKILKERKIPCVVMEPVKGGKLASFNKNISKDFLEYNNKNSLASWALRWVGSLEGVKVILSGMNDEKQVIDNLNTFSPFICLNNEEQKLVASVSEKLKGIVKVGCTNCKYCMPCPKGVEIPVMFSIYNDYAMYENENSSKWNFLRYKKENKTLENCIKCNACTKKCPQGIKIPDEFEKMKKEMKFINDIN